MKRKTFIDFYLDTADEDPEYIEEYFKEEGIDIEKAKRELLEFVRKKKEELKLEEGKESPDGRTMK